MICSFNQIIKKNVFTDIFINFLLYFRIIKKKCIYKHFYKFSIIFFIITDSILLLNIETDIKIIHIINDFSENLKLK